MVPSTMLMLLGVVLGSLLTDLEIFFVCTMFIGFAYGSLFALSPPILTERFGQKHFGTNWYAFFHFSLAFKIKIK